MIKQLFDMMTTANHHDTSSSVVGVCTKIEISAQIPRPKSLFSKSNDFVSSEITSYIVNNSTHTLKFACEINSRHITLTFITFKPHINSKKYQSLARKVFMWIDISSKSATCVKTLHIYIYLTPFKKQMPSAHGLVLGADNANSGYTYPCKDHNEIIIYRKEEWFKVFIHETMHSFGHDTYSNIQDDESAEKVIRDIFSMPHNVTILLSETYSEIWARIISCAFHSFRHPTFDSFSKKMHECMDMESQFSLYQAIKVISYMGLTYGSFITPNSKNKVKSAYKENTNIFAYYVLTAIIMTHYKEFFDWCIKHNGATSVFTLNTPELSFATFIKECYRTDTLLQNVTEMEEEHVENYNSDDNSKHYSFLRTTMRMTIIS